MQEKKKQCIYTHEQQHGDKRFCQVYMSSVALYLTLYSLLYFRD